MMAVDWPLSLTFSERTGDAKRLRSNSPGRTKLMTSQINLWKAISVFVLIGCGSVCGQAPAQQPSDPAVAALGQGFASTTASVNGTTLHYVRGGTGPAVILLHGFPQDWY